MNRKLNSYGNAANKTSGGEVFAGNRCTCVGCGWGPPFFARGEGRRATSGLG